MTPAEELRTAAAKIRSAAQAAGGASWIADHHERGTVVRPADSMLSLFRLAAHGNQAAGTPHVTPAVGTHMALMDPAVGLALADWLDYEADLMGPGSERRGRTEHALTVARALLGGEPR